METADDILEELGAFDSARARPDGGGRPPRAGAAPDEDAVLRSLPPGEACDLDLVAARTGLAAAHLLPRLLALELAGAIRRAEGGRFVRVDIPC